MSKKIRVGIIGAGDIANNVHIPAYKSLGDQVELVAISDVVPEVVRARAEAHGFEHHFTSYEEMLAKAELDCVSICTPNRFHGPATIAALEAGVHVLCEKPPAVNADEAKAMAAAAAKAGKELRYGFHNRFNPNVQAARRFVEAGEFGEIYAGEASWMRRRSVPARPGFIRKELSGGGPLIDIGVHMLDAALHLMGYPQPVEVMGTTYRKLGDRPGVVGFWGPWNPEDYTVEDLAMGMIRFANGATLFLKASFLANIEPNEQLDIRLMGTDAGVRVFPEVKLFKEMHGTVVDIAPSWMPKVQAHQAEIAAFVGLVAGTGDGGPLCTPEEGIKVQQIIDNLYLSAESDSAIKIG